MKMKFQPKIIIGSLVGIVSSVIGIIAIFFPSLFNLETKKIEEFTCVMQTYEDCERLSEFLSLCAKNEGIFKLNVSFAKSKNFEKKIDKSHNPAINEPCIAQYEFSYNAEYAEKYFRLYDQDERLLKTQEDYPTMYAEHFEFTGLNIKKSMPDDVLSKLEGYFTWEKFYNVAPGEIGIKFKKVPNEEIILKKY